MIHSSTVADKVARLDLTRIDPLHGDRALGIEQYFIMSQAPDGISSHGLIAGDYAITGFGVIENHTCFVGDVPVFHVGTNNFVDLGSIDLAAASAALNMTAAQDAQSARKHTNTDNSGKDYYTGAASYTGSAAMVTPASEADLTAASVHFAQGGLNDVHPQAAVFRSRVPQATVLDGNGCPIGLHRSVTAAGLPVASVSMDAIVLEQRAPAEGEKAKPSLSNPGAELPGLNFTEMPGQPGVFRYALDENTSYIGADCQVIGREAFVAWASGKPNLLASFTTLTGFDGKNWGAPQVRLYVGDVAGKKGCSRMEQFGFSN
jgi:hypothetical protein